MWGFGICWGPILPMDMFEKPAKPPSKNVKPALGSLTKVAALPGSGGGRMSALPAEVNKAKPKEKDWTPVYHKADSHDELVFPPIDPGPGI